MSQDITSRKPLGLIELVDKQLQVSMLKTAIARGRLGGTLLFTGPDGSGKSSLAFWLAAALNCTSSNLQAIPCASCASCRKVETLNHPDVFWIMPLPGSFYRGENIDSEKLADIFRQKRETPWLDVQFPEKSEHHLAAVSRIRSEAATSCYEGRKKVFIITAADRLRVEAANAFLKLLEEPRANQILILCSDRPASLLPTILSRCQKLQVVRPSFSRSVSLLTERFGASEQEARQLLSMADGNLTAALRMRTEESFQAQKKWVEKTFQAVLHPDSGDWYSLIDNRKGPLWNRGDFERYLSVLIQSLHDVLLFCLGRNRPAGELGGSAVTSSGSREYASRVMDSQSLVNLLGRLVNLRDALNRNINLRLLGWSILRQMKEVVQDEC
ncbi:MAG: hypothetical protein DRG82_17260 [Deltaproteobacteria bacterium]|nr:MAG: hypothetical protein DRG82_17260 [Deltaproteobacteria bacterium]